jgi:curved DNA-binding protein CbpA
MTSQQPDYYAVLGVGPGASAADVGRAYRRAARASHPDIHPHDAAAADRFRAVTDAYETLSDPERRASYDHTRPSVGPAPVRIVVRRRPSAGPVHLGRRPQTPTTLQPLRAGPAIPLLAGELVDLVEAFARMVTGWPFL